MTDTSDSTRRPTKIFSINLIGAEFLRQNADRYFGKKLDELDLVEAGQVIGILLGLSATQGKSDGSIKMKSMTMSDGEPVVSTGVAALDEAERIGRDSISIAPDVDEVIVIEVTDTLLPKLRWRDKVLGNQLNPVEHIVESYTYQTPQ